MDFHQNIRPNRKDNGNNDFPNSRTFETYQKRFIQTIRTMRFIVYKNIKNKARLCRSLKFAGVAMDTI